VRFISGWQFLFDTDLAAEPTNERLVEAVASLLGVDPAAPIDETND
jgi:hypothetical protein